MIPRLLARNPRPGWGLRSTSSALARTCSPISSSLFSSSLSRPTSACSSPTRSVWERRSKLASSCSSWLLVSRCAHTRSRRRRRARACSGSVTEGLLLTVFVRTVGTALAKTVSRCAQEAAGTKAAQEEGIVRPRVTARARLCPRWGSLIVPLPALLGCGRLRDCRRRAEPGVNRWLRPGRRGE